MSENSEKDTSSSPPVVAASAGIARRKLIRAGLAAAPVMLALKGQSALAGGVGGDHLNCSVWASLSAAKGCMRSHAPVPGKSCGNYIEWSANTTHPVCNHKFHSDPNTNNRVPFDDDCFRDWNANTRSHSYHSLRNVCAGKKADGITNHYVGDSRKQLLGKHCAAMFLNYQQGICPISDVEIKKLWTACKDGSGTWKPPYSGSVGWDREQCIAYFEYVCNGVAPWSIDCKKA